MRSECEEQVQGAIVRSECETLFSVFLFLIDTLRVTNEPDVQVLVLICIRCGLRWVVMSFGGDMIS